MGDLNVRLERIARRLKGENLYGERIHAWGIPPEEVRRQWEVWPERIAARAVEIKVSRERGEPEEDPHDRCSGAELMARAVSYGHHEDIPPELIKALDSRYVGLPEPARERMRELVTGVLFRAFEHFHRAASTG